MEIKFNCPLCNMGTSITHLKPGETAQCHNCKSEIKVPNPGESPQLLKTGAIPPPAATTGASTTTQITIDKELICLFLSLGGMGIAWFGGGVSGIMGGAFSDMVKVLLGIGFVACVIGFIWSYQLLQEIRKTSPGNAIKTTLCIISFVCSSLAGVNLLLTVLGILFVGR